MAELSRLAGSFFFSSRRRHTRWNCDWSSDVCSSDLAQIDVSRPLIVADGERLPFADRSVAYAIALHVLEHATDPRAFAEELARVAPAGFAQVPTREAELTFGWPYHPWLIDRDGDTLIFVPREDRKAPAGELFHRAYV